MANTWRTARALDKLKAQINALEPTRDRTSDGTIGDAAHAATKSEHNPNKHGVVTAFDCTHDPVDGVDCNVLCAALIASKDPRILYVIWNRGMYRSYPKPGIAPWTRSEYKGKNPHTHHLHISLIDDDDGVDALYDDERPWALPADLSARATTPPNSVRYGDSGAAVRWAIERLRVHGFELPTSSLFTSSVKAAVIKFQQDRGLVADGIVGRATREALAAAPRATTPVTRNEPAPAPQPAPPPLDPTTIAVVAGGFGLAAWNFFGWVGVGTVVVAAMALLLVYIRLRRRAK